MMATFARKWFWEKSAFVLAACVLCGLIAGLMLPPTSPALPAWAFAQIIMAFVVMAREGMRLVHE